MTQIARNLTDIEDGFLRGTQYLILDRDTKYSAEFRAALVRDGIHLIRLPPRSPNLNAFAERFVRSIKSECLNRMIFFGRDSLQHAISQFMSHYNWPSYVPHLAMSLINRECLVLCLIPQAPAGGRARALQASRPRRIAVRRD